MCACVVACLLPLSLVRSTLLTLCVQTVPRRLASWQAHVTMDTQAWATLKALPPEMLLW